jgi:hypothetical protein
MVSEVLLYKLSGGRYRTTHFSEKQAMSLKGIIYSSDQKLCFLCEEQINVIFLRVYGVLCSYECFLLLLLALILITLKPLSKHSLFLQMIKVYKYITRHVVC